VYSVQNQTYHKLLLEIIAGRQREMSVELVVQIPTNIVVARMFEERL
jgi:hypothetical protein